MKRLAVNMKINRHELAVLLAIKELSAQSLDTELRDISACVFHEFAPTADEKMRIAEKLQKAGYGRTQNNAISVFDMYIHSLINNLLEHGLITEVEIPNDYSQYRLADNRF